METITNAIDPRHIVNGAQLPSFMGKPISVFGCVSQPGRMGATSFRLNTTDNIEILVHLDKPLTSELSGGYVEVKGVCEMSREGRVIQAENFYTFNNTNFNAKGHNMLCKLMNSIPNVYNLKKE